MVKCIEMPDQDSKSGNFCPYGYVAIPDCQKGAVAALITDNDSPDYVDGSYAMNRQHDSRQLGGNCC